MRVTEKLTTGIVVQRFDDHGKCIEQRFAASDEVEYIVNGLTRFSESLDYPFDMVQPEMEQY